MHVDPMQTRDGGAAHVNIFFPLILLVLLMGALGFAWVTHTELEEAKKARVEARAAQAVAIAEKNIRDDYIKEISALIGETGSYAGNGGYGEGVESLEGVTLPANVKSALTDFAGQADVPVSQISPLSAFLGKAKSTLDAKEATITGQKSQMAKLQQQVDAANATVAQTNQARQQEVAKLTQEKTEQRQYIDSEFNKRDQTNAQLQVQLRTRREEMDKLQEDHAQKVTELTGEKDLLTARIQAAKGLTELVNPPQEPDGRVISGSQAAGKAWINLGRKDLLPRGTVFTITPPNSNQVKARGVVTRVEYDRAEIAISDLRDRFEPVVKGDLIRNDLYSPHVRRNIYLLGRFSYPLTKDTVKLTLENLGNKVHDTIGPGVDLVIVGGDTLNEEGSGFTPVDKTPEYEKALFLGIEIAPLHKVREYLKLDAGTKVSRN